MNQPRNRLPPQLRKSNVAYFGIKSGLKCRICGVCRLQGKACQAGPPGQKCGSERTKAVELVFNGPAEANMIGERRQVLDQLRERWGQQRITLTPDNDGGGFDETITVFMGPAYDYMDKPPQETPQTKRKALLAKRKKLSRKSR